MNKTAQIKRTIYEIWDHSRERNRERIGKGKTGRKW